MVKYFSHRRHKLNYCDLSIIIIHYSRQPEKKEKESSDDAALFFPKALNAWFCLAGLLTCPGFKSLPIFTHFLAADSGRYFKP
jgi:hypothetical protein